MKSILPLTVIGLLLMSSASSADSPDENTIPIFAERPEMNTISLDTFLMLSWNYFDVVQSGDYWPQFYIDNLVGPSNETGMFLCIAPGTIQRWGHWPDTWAARMSDYSTDPAFSFSGDSAYTRPEWAGITLFFSSHPLHFHPIL